MSIRKHKEKARFGQKPGTGASHDPGKRAIGLLSRKPEHDVPASPTYGLRGSQGGGRQVPKVPRYLATPHYGLYNNVCQETRNQNKPYSWVQRETRQKTSQRGGLQICRR